VRSGSRLGAVRARAEVAWLLKAELPRLRSGFWRAAQFSACPEQLSGAKLSNGPRKRLNFDSATAWLREGVAALGVTARRGVAGLDRGKGAAKENGRMPKDVG